MQANLKQILGTILAAIIMVASFIVLAPFILFLFLFAVVFAVIAIFLVRRKIKKMMKENPDLFANSRFYKGGRVIDEEEIISEEYDSNSNKRLD